MGERKKITIVEKGDPYEQAKKQLIKIRNALSTLKEMGISEDLMKLFIYAKTKVPKRDIETILRSQKSFLISLNLLPSNKWCQTCETITPHFSNKCTKH